MKHSTLQILSLVFAVVLAGCGGYAGDSRPGTASSSPGNANPLPDSAYKAAITLENPPRTLRAGEEASLKVKVKNIGNGTWPALVPGARYRVDLGNHWLDKNGATVTLDDGRADLPHDLKPGEELELVLKVKAPKEPRDYILELDMVHEALTWFSAHGSQTSKTNITVQ
jgi:hypothetical protein